MILSDEEVGRAISDLQTTLHNVQQMQDLLWICAAVLLAFCVYFFIGIISGD